jgi:hypothetical protein
MLILVDSSTLIAASVFWEFSKNGYLITAKHNAVCDDFFKIIKSTKDTTCIITKTTEEESKAVLNKIVNDIVERKFNSLPSFLKMFSLMKLQDAVTQASTDRLEKIVEEISSRKPIDMTERESIKKELYAFFRENVPKTFKYVKPTMPSKLPGPISSKREILDAMAHELLNSLPVKGIIYRGFPEPKDITLMAEATYLYRSSQTKEKVYIASLDNHFKPNPIQVTHDLTDRLVFSGKVDSTIRDMLEEKFGFRGDFPGEIIKELTKKDIIKKT